jgi:hypothetical protein
MTDTTCLDEIMRVWDDLMDLILPCRWKRLGNGRRPWQ